MSSNKQYKNSVFSFLFSTPDVLRELYSAIEGVTLPHDIPVNINTLSDVLFMNQINDISFTIDNRLVVLIEHQSTINENMPLRLLMYIARIYEKIIDRNKLYKTKLEKIPTPKFIVLYNGKEPYPDRKVLKLSQAFINGGLKESEPAPLELTVQVYNINSGHNPDLLKKSETLDGYSVFVEKVRECEKKLPLEEAMKNAVKYCIEHDILKQFLTMQSSEVFNMLLTEWNLDEAKEAWFEEGLEEGLERGREEGLERGREEGIEEGLEKGREEGLEEGREERNEEIACNALAEGASVEFVQKITGLDIETIENIRAGK